MLSKEEVIQAKRISVCDEIYYDPLRSGRYGVICEGTWMVPKHICSPRNDLNEVLYPRRVFQKMPLEDQLRFYHFFNCAINCRTFHTKWGHSREYRAWHLRRMIALYGYEEVSLWNDSLPLLSGKLVLPHLERKC